MSGRRPAYYEEIDEKFNKLELKQREFGESLDNVQVSQAEQMSRINQIHYLLAGTDYENKNNGGLVGEITRIKCKVHKNTSWRIRITAAGSAVASIIGFILFKFGTILTALKELILKQ